MGLWVPTIYEVVWTVLLATRVGERGLVGATAGTLIVGRRAVNRDSELVALLSTRRKLVHTFIHHTGLTGDHSTDTASLFTCNSFSLCHNGSTCAISSIAPVRIFFSLQGSVRELTLTRCFTRLSFRIKTRRRPYRRLLQLVLGSLRLLYGNDGKLLRVGTIFRFHTVYLNNCVPDILTYSGYNACRARLVCFSALRNGVCYRGYPGPNTIPIPGAIVGTVECVYLARPTGVFSFALDSRGATLLTSITRGCAVDHVRHNLSTLRFCGTLWWWVLFWF